VIGEESKRYLSPILAELCYSETLSEWCEYTHLERGWETGPNVGGSLVDDLVRGVEA